MKLKTILLLIIPFVLMGCVNNDALIEKVKNSKYELRKFNVKSTRSSQASGWYFLVMGGYSSSDSERAIVRFYYKNSDGEYQLMEEALQNVNIKIDNTVKTPYVTFKGVYSDAPGVDEDLLIKYSDRSVIHCRDSDFQPEININDLK